MAAASIPRSLALLPGISGAIHGRDRLEAFLFLNFVGITIHALIERELRKAMEANSIEVLPLYPEGRDCRAPTTARIIEIFGNLQSVNRQV